MKKEGIKDYFDEDIIELQMKIDRTLKDIRDDRNTFATTLLGVHLEFYRIRSENYRDELSHLETGFSAMLTLLSVFLTGLATTSILDLNLSASNIGLVLPVFLAMASAVVLFILGYLWEERKRLLEIRKSLHEAYSNIAQITIDHIEKAHKDYVDQGDKVEKRINKIKLRS